MAFLDLNGLKRLVTNIKTLLNNYLPKTGGTISGNLIVQKQLSVGTSYSESTRSGALYLGGALFTGITEAGTMYVRGMIQHNPASGTATYSITEAGKATFASTVTCQSLSQTSDERLKDNIYPIIEDVDKIKNIEFKEFNLANDTSGRKSYGVLAQDLERAELENLVYEDDEGIKSVDYTSLMILELQRLRNEVKELKEKLAE